jgi:alpha-beta hydrolase superfamily lysophospholipase
MLTEFRFSPGIAMVRFDYRGHGLSGGQFDACTISDWLQDAKDVLHALTVGPQVEFRWRTKLIIIQYYWPEEG